MRSLIAHEWGRDLRMHLEFNSDRRRSLRKCQSVSAVSAFSMECIGSGSIHVTCHFPSVTGVFCSGDPGHFRPPGSTGCDLCGHPCPNTETGSASGDDASALSSPGAPSPPAPSQTHFRKGPDDCSAQPAPHRNHQESPISPAQNNTTSPPRQPAHSAAEPTRQSCAFETAKIFLSDSCPQYTVELGGQPIHKIQPTTLGVPFKAHKGDNLREHKG